MQKLVRQGLSLLALIWTLAGCNAIADKDMGPTTGFVTSAKAVVITVELDTGKVVDVRAINGATKSDMKEGELKDIHGKIGKGYDTVAVILHSHSSPGCIRVIGGSLVKIC